MPANLIGRTESAAMEPISLDLGLTNIHVIITGGAGLIGRVVVDHFLAAGAKVSSLDIVYSTERGPGRPFATEDTGASALAIHCDVSSEESVAQAFATAAAVHGPASICVALASLDLSVLQPSSFADASFEQLQRVLEVNVGGTWLTAREWIRGLRQARRDDMDLRHPNLILIGSESGHFGERRNAEYALGKSAIHGGLLMSLRAEAPREWPGARVNVIAPGPVMTERWFEECRLRPEQAWEEARATTALGEATPMRAVAMAILSLASHGFSSHIHGQIINVDGGKQGKVMWSGAEKSLPDT